MPLQGRAAARRARPATKTLSAWLIVLTAIFVATPQHSSAAQGDSPGGQALFQTHCAVCHGPNGEGGRGPTLAVPRLAQARSDETLLWIIEWGLDGTGMPASVLNEAEMKQVAAWVRRLGQLPPQVVPGNAERGALLYRGKGGCARCHALDGHGGAYGPDLSDIGVRRGVAYLRTSLVDPGADVPIVLPTAARTGVAIPANFLVVHAETKGKEISGVRVNEDAFSIQIREIDGTLHSLLKADITTLTKDWGKSPMPSFRTRFTAEELDDVVAFLASQRVEP